MASKIEKLHALMQLFIIKPKYISVFSPTARLCVVNYFIKTGNIVKWGKKWDFRKWQRKYALWSTKRFIFYHWPKIAHKNVNLWPQGSKIDLQNPKIVLRPYFRPLRTPMASNFRFCMWFLISDKIQSVFSVSILKIGFFYPILQYCQFLWNTEPHIVEKKQ